MNDETFAEITSVKLTPLNILSMFSGLLLFFAILMYALFSYTPLRSLIPQELSSTEKRELMEVYEEFKELEEELEIRNQKSEVLNNLLSDNESKYDSTSVRRRESVSN
ncbi:hypothetical protein N9M15_04755 [Bacteroidia bacterium]|nr:hypothetical protein [Bacteroidia bacterium]